MPKGGFIPAMPVWLQVDIMNETLDLLRKRRSLPPYQLTGPGPDRKGLVSLLTLAARVPDHGKLAPWRFIVIEGEARARLGSVSAKAAEHDRGPLPEDALAAEEQRFMKAPVVVALVSRARPHPKIPLWEQELSVGAVAMNLLLASEAAGFSAVWVTEWCAFDRRILDELGVRADEKLAGFIHIGTPALKLDERTDRVRPEMAEIISYYGE